MMLTLGVKLSILKVLVSFPCPLSLPFLQMITPSMPCFNPFQFSHLLVKLYSLCHAICHFWHSISLFSYSMDIKSMFYCPVSMSHQLVNKPIFISHFFFFVYHVEENWVPQETLLMKGMFLVLREGVYLFKLHNCF